MDAPYEIFNDKDIRMWATMILPGTQWKGQKIIIQEGFIRPDGSYVFRTDASTQGKMERPTIRLVRRIRKCIRDLVLLVVTTPVLVSSSQILAGK